MSEIVIDVGFRDDDYIFMPACCYYGNRFRCLDKQYPPMFTPEEASVDMPTTITNVPRLEPDGSGSIEVTAADLSVPCIGVYNRAERKGHLLFTVPRLEGEVVGVAYNNGKMILTAPAHRSVIYTMCTLTENSEARQDIDTPIPHRYLSFECDSLDAFFRVFFENRKIMGLDDSLPAVPAREEQIKLQIKKFNERNWHEKGQFYTVGCYDVNHSKFQVWQPGWVGGAMYTYALMKLGGEQEYKRSVKTLLHLFRYQGKSGLFYGGCDDELNSFGDGFNVAGTDQWTLVRKSADALYFVLRHFELMNEIPEEIINGTKKCADRFVAMWERYGQLGQFADVESGEIIVGGSASAGIAPAGLTLAYKFFGDKKYLESAAAVGEYYYRNFISLGYTTGGPGEILQCPDSESAFGLLESYVTLYAETRENRFLEMAKATAHLCSSWVMPYNYEFPSESEFGRLGMRTVGSVFANVQNKHSAPGICTLSGTSLKRLYEYTGDELYLDMYREIGESIAQYMSTEERPIRAGMNDGSPTLPAGFICERVNTSDWETERGVGEVFLGSCWCEASNILYLAEM